MSRTNDVIHKLLYYVVTRGVLALASQIGFLIVTVLSPSALDW